MDKKQLLETLARSRAEFLTAIEGLSEAELLSPALDNGWSYKDLLAHLTMWEAQLITLLFNVAQGKAPGTVHFTQSSVDETNARWHAQNRERPLAQILADFRGIRAQTIRRVEAFSERELFEQGRYPWAKGHSLAEWIASDTYEHEAEHLAQIRARRS